MIIFDPSSCQRGCWMTPRVKKNLQECDLDWINEKLNGALDIMDFEMFWPVPKKIQVWMTLL